MISENKISLKGLSVWFICALFFMYEFLLRTVLGTFQHPLMQDLQLTPVRFALLSSTAYQLIYGLMQIPVGIIVDRYGLKKTLLSAVVVCAFANFGFSLTHHFAGAVIFRVLMGLGSSFGFICLLVAVYEWMPRKNIALFIGLSQFIGTLGPMLAAGPLNMLVHGALVSWREIFMGLAGMGAVIAVLVLFFVDKNRHSQGKFTILSRPSAVTDNLRRLMSYPQIWFIAIFSASVYFSIEYLSENEGTSFLVRKGFSSNFSSYMITLAWLGYAVSCPVLGYISDKIQRRKPVMYISAIVAFLALIGIIYFPLGENLTALCFVLLGFGASGQSIGFAIMAEQCKEDYLALGLGLNNALIMLLAAVNAPLIGSILSNLSTTYPVSISNYQTAFTLMPFVVLTGILVAFFGIRETFCKSMRENTPLHPDFPQR